MKKTIFILLFTVVTLTATQAQKSNYVHISGDAGFVVNTERDKKFGLGGTIGWLTYDNLISQNPYNYISLSVKGFNNPYGEGKFLGSMFNDKDDAFNYIMFLAGYRFTQQGLTEGLFVEPRMGVVIGASGYTGFAFSPMAGYAYRNFDFSLFCDMGFGNKVSAIRNKNFFTPGISIGYNIGF
ncbi:MAG: hypothetical protein JJE08_07705 [Proteiniphilum sp.]|nr:hypothetical protein [Proteiniphilum sp.]